MEIGILLSLLFLSGIYLAGKIFFKWVEFIDELEIRKEKLEKKLLSEFKVIVVSAQYLKEPRFGGPGTVITVNYGLIKAANGKNWQSWTKAKGKTPVDKLNRYFYHDAKGTEKTKFKKYVERKHIGDVIEW